MTSPTFIAEYESAWNTGTTPKTASVSVDAGDVLVIIGIAESSSTVVGPPTGGSLTYALKQDVTTAGNCRVTLWTSTAPGGQSFTLSVPSDSGTNWYGFNCLRFSGASVGASAKTNSVGAPSLDLTTTVANSAIVCGNGDFLAVDGASRTWRTINSITPAAGDGEKTYFRDAIHYATYIAYWSDVGATGTKTTGLSAPTGQTFGIVAVEVIGLTPETGVDQGVLRKVPRAFRVKR